MNVVYFEPMSGMIFEGHQYLCDLFRADSYIRKLASLFDEVLGWSADPDSGGGDMILWKSHCSCVRFLRIGQTLKENWITAGIQKRNGKTVD